MAEAVTHGWDADVVLGDGETVHLRAITPQDAPALADFHHRQSKESLYRRYFSPKGELSESELAHFTNVDMHDRVAIVVERQGELIGWASYERWPGRHDADSAFMVDDAMHGKGIAPLMLEHLAAIAQANGITRFTAEVLADNRPMLSVFAKAGWPLERHFESGVVDLGFDITDTKEFIDSVERREQRADSQAMARLLLPRTIAVVGATDRPGSVGAELWRNTNAVATGAVYAVNPNRDSIGDRPCWPTIAAIGRGLSLAVIAVPPHAVPAAIDDCIAARVRGAVVITDLDGSGIDVPALVARARSNGVRIVGPASMGMASSRPDVGLGAALIPVRLQPGSVAVSLQSGTLGASLLRAAEELEIDLSWFVSLGDRSDVSGNDLLQFWDDDEATRVIAMYTENLGNPRKFARIARRVSRRRPIVAVRTGAAAIEPSAEAMYRHAGLIEVPTVRALLDTVRVLATQPTMSGPRVAVLSNSRSPATLARAALETAHLLPLEPPIALRWRSTADDYRDAVERAVVDERFDAVLVIHAPPLAGAPEPRREIEEAAASGAKPVLAVMLGGHDGPIVAGGKVPAFTFPEAAAGVLGRMHAYGHWLATEADAPEAELGPVAAETVEEVLNGALARGASRLDLEETKQLLGAYGLHFPQSRNVDADDAVAAARQIGYPVAVKADHRKLGRSVQAGVALDLADDADVAGSVAEMRRSIGEAARRVTVQEMVPPGLDLRVRCTLDPRFGSVVAVGLGSRQADLLAHEGSAIAPLTPVAAATLLAESAAGPALEAAGLNAAPVIDTIVRIAQVAADHDVITRLDVNPLMVSAAGCFVADVDIDVTARSGEPAPLRRID